MKKKQVRLDEIVETKSLATLEQGKLFVRKEDIWMIDTTNPEFTVVSMREEKIKVIPAEQVLI